MAEEKKEATAAEVGLSGDEQIRIALRTLIDQGGEALMQDIYRAVEAKMNGYVLSEQGKASLRYFINKTAVERGYIQPHDPTHPWRITAKGRRYIAPPKIEQLSRFRIERFKCFADQTVTFKELTLLAGKNGTGKSTVIQALLLLRQAYLRDSLTQGELRLNGMLAEIGTAQDALYSDSHIDSIAFHVWGDDQSFDFTFAVERDEFEGDTLYGDPLFIEDSRDSLDVDNSSQDVLDLLPVNLFEQPLSYLQAERWGPRSQYPMSDLSPEKMSVGVQGEYTAHCLAQFGNDQINNLKLAYPGRDNDTTLKHQTQLWMGSIAPDLDIETTSLRPTKTVLLRLNNYRPPNTGFGVSYALPIVVAGLMAKPGSMLIVENPEAHLHPAAQSEIGQFLAQAAASGIQVIIETHSDHILNGIRLSVLQDVLPPEKVSIQFFSFSPVEYKYEVFSPKIDADGRIDFWPKGFFDQIEKDLLELF